jgi:hypothetical protein
MAAPDYVPRPKAEKARVYESPPWSGDSWEQDRPAELMAGQPMGPRLGYPGPDQGFALKLVRLFEGQLALAPGEHEADAVAGCTAVALKRASLFGRAPVVYDLQIAFTIFGYWPPGNQPDPALVKLRKPLFEEVANLHHYSELRHIVDLVPVAVLQLTPDAVAAQAASDWRAFFKRKSAGVA